jgi:glycosyltransferase involved in cell wall biosynthesis
MLGKLFETQYSNNYKKIIVTSPTITLFCKKHSNYTLWLHNCRTIKIKKIIKQKKYKLLFNPLSLFLFRTIEGICYKKYKEIYCCTEELREKLIKEFNLSPNTVKIQNTIINTKIFFKNNKIKKIYDYIFVGRGSRQKGFDIVIKLAKEKLNKKYLAIVNLIEKEFIDKIPNNIKIIYKVPNEKMGFYYNQSQSLLLPSRDEEQPLVILEALQCGINIIASKEALRNISLPNFISNKRHKLFKTIGNENYLSRDVAII